MNNAILAMILFALVGAITPGPVNLLATTTAVNYGKRTATGHVVGAALAYAIVIFLSGTVMHKLLMMMPQFELTMKLCGSLFLLYLSYSIYFSSGNTIDAASNTKSGLWTGSLTQFLNPKAWIVAMSGVSLYVVGQKNEHLSLVIFTGVSLIICLIGVGMWAAIGRLLVKHLENPTKQRRFNRVMAGLLATSIIMLWL